MAKTQQLIDDLEKRKALFNIALAGTDEGSPLGVNPIVQEAIDALKPSATPTVSPSSEEGKVNITLGGALKGATIPFVPGQPVTGIQPVAAAATPAMQSPEAVGTTDTFLDLLMRNNELRMRNDAELKRNEKANQARTRIAAISDAIASLGNLIGTTQGAFNQPQTYSTPFVTEQVEQDRALARQRANMLERTDNELRLAKMKMDATAANYDRQLAIQDAISQRALNNAIARANLEADKHGYRTDENAQKAGYTREIHQMDNESREKRTNTSAGVSAANNRRNVQFKYDELDAKKNGQIGSGSGGVGGYTTRTEYEYDELGHKTSETKTRTGSNGQTTTTTTTTSSGGKKPNPMGSSSQPSGSKKKKKNPMN